MIAQQDFDLDAWLDAETAAALAASLRSRSYGKGQIIYHQGDAGQTMFRVTSGIVRLSVRRPDGSEAIMLYFGEGDYFGVSSLVDDGPRPHSAEAFTPVKLQLLNQAAFQRLRSDRPRFFEAIARLLVAQMRFVSAHYVNSCLNSLESRVATRILELRRLFESSLCSQRCVEIHLSQGELAAMVGVSRQSVNKALNALARRGAIALGPRSFTILDETALSWLNSGDNQACQLLDSSMAALSLA